MWILNNETHHSLDNILLMLTIDEIKTIQHTLNCLLDEPNSQFHVMDKVSGREISFGLNQLYCDGQTPELLEIEADRDC
jgi:hypothetical protein